MIKEILVVDDDPMYIELVKEMLSDRGVHVVTAGNGKEAMSILQNARFDLIISDVGMPIMDGITLHVQMLKSNHLANVPFVFMTGMADEPVRQYVARTPGLRLIRKENLIKELSELISHLE